MCSCIDVLLYHYSECFLDNKNNRWHIYLIILLVLVDNEKLKKGWDILFFNYTKIKLKIWVSYSFKAALVYRWPYRSMHFCCHGTILKNICQ